MTNVRLVFLLWWFVGAAVHAQVAASDPATLPVSSAYELLVAAKAHLDVKNPQAAIADLDQLIARYEAQYKGSTQTIFGARSLAENLFYLAQAPTDKKETIVIEPFWGDAYYFKAYALVELGQLAAAERSLDRAILLSPRSSLYLNERGEINSRKKDWSKATEAFVKAAEAVDVSPTQNKNDNLTHAWRGLAYVDVELGKLAEAENLYKQCLALNPADKRAAAELKYVQVQRERQGMR